MTKLKILTHVITLFVISIQVIGNYVIFDKMIRGSNSEILGNLYFGLFLIFATSMITATWVYRNYLVLNKPNNKKSDPNFLYQ